MTAVFAEDAALFALLYFSKWEQQSMPPGKWWDSISIRLTI
jgi:hypothetical protein